MKFGLTRKENNVPDVRTLRNSMDRLFDAFFSLGPMEFFDSEWLPAVDMYDDEKNIKTLKVMVSNFVKKLKSKKRRKLKDEVQNVDSNSSQSTNKEEPENKTSNDTQIGEENQIPKKSIFQQIAQKNNTNK